ncbi:MAG TPA: response regulator transcription factor [Solirubrobacterales bacterium]
MGNRKERVSVVIADDHPVYRSGLARMVGQRPELTLVAEADSGRKALDAIREHGPQVAVVDLKMPDLDGLAILNAVKREDLETKIVMLTGYAEGETAYEVMAAGAAAYLSKASEPDTVCETITTVARGGTYLAPEFHGALADQIKLRATDPGPILSDREREVLRLTAEGNSVAQIGEHLHLSAATIKTHLQHSYRKLGVSDRAAAVAEAMRRGLME